MIVAKNGILNQKLVEILEYYEDTWTVTEPLQDIYDELIANNVEVNGNCFFCPIYNEELNAYIMVTGAKGEANTWVLRQIIKLIKSGEQIYTVINGNSDKILKVFAKYGAERITEQDGLVYMSINRRK